MPLPDPDLPAAGPPPAVRAPSVSREEAVVALRRHADRLEVRGHRVAVATRAAAAALEEGRRLDDDARWALALAVDAFGCADPFHVACAGVLVDDVAPAPVRVPDWAPRSYGRPVVVPRALRGLRRVEHDRGPRRPPAASARRGAGR